MTRVLQKQVHGIYLKVPAQARSPILLIRYPMRKGIVYYSDGKLDPVIRDIVIRQLNRRNWTIHDTAVCVYPPEGATPGILTMHKQILHGLECVETDVVFMAEHDVLYSPSHFAFVPLRSDTFYYNVNVVHVRWPDGYAVAWDDCQQVSGLCAYRELLIDYYQARIAQIEREGFNRHYEPGLKQTVAGS